MKKAGRSKSGPCSSQLRTSLENELCAQLHGSWTARSHSGIRGRDIGRCTTASERTHGRIIQTKSVLAPVRIGKVRMIENVEELRPELQAILLAEAEILANGEIKVLEAGILEHVSSHISELAKRRRHHHGITRDVAAEQIQSCRLRARRAPILRQRRGSTAGRHSGISRRVERNADPFSRFKVRRVPETGSAGTVKAPTNGLSRRRTDRQRSRPGSVCSQVDRSPELRTLQCGD